MPGLVGLVTRKPADVAVRELRQMLASMCHEPFYVVGCISIESMGVYLGWVAQRGSFADPMPIHNERRDVVLAFSGEEVSEPGTIEALRVRGHDVTGGANYLVHKYEENPSTFPESLNGRFHGMLVDRSRRHATLFVDRYGLHRLYYHQANDAFYFAAEAKAILAVRPELRRLDNQALGEFVTCGCTLENRSLFVDISVLPAAAKWQFDDGHHAPQRRSFFTSASWEQQVPLGAADFYKQFRDLFSQRLPLYCNSGDQAVALSLTGGLDSRMLLAWHRGTDGDLPCYTFAGPFRENHDVRVARRVAKACGQPHQVIRVGHEFLEEFPRLSERSVYLTDGCVDVSRAADLYVNRKAREMAPVRLTGNYGGEVLRGVRAFKPMPLSSEMFAPELRSALHQAANTYAHIADSPPLSFGVFRQAPWHHYGLLALEQTQLTVRSPFLDNELVRTVFRAPKFVLSDDRLSRRVIFDGNAALSDIPTDRGVGRRSNAAMWFMRGILQAQFKAEYAYDYGMPQWLAPLDRAFSFAAPERLFLGRHKFCHFRLWYRRELASHVMSVLTDHQSLDRPYLNASVVRKAVTEHVRGMRNTTLAIHKLLTLEHIHRLFLAPAQPSLRNDIPEPECA